MDPAVEPGTKVSAAYGHACANCVKAKSRCIPRGGSCERCHRLSKDCQPATFVRKRVAKRSAASSRKSQLEEKLENLVTLLQAQNAPQAAGTQAAQPQYQTSQQPTSDLGSRSQKTFSTTSEARAPPTPVTSGSASHGSPLPDEAKSQAEQDLLIFRTRYLGFFPCVHIPPGTTAEQLQRERPLLYKAIRVASTGSRACQKKLGLEVREEIALRAVANGERNLELLLALLVCMSWFFYFTRAKPTLGMFASVARSLVADLKLDRPSPGVQLCPGDPPLPYLREVSETRTDEERRALVACFALSAMVSVALRYEPMRWSPQIAESCQRLSLTHGVPGDSILVAMACISKVAVEGARIIQRLHEDPDYAVHAILHINALRTLFDDVKATLTAEQLDNKTVLAYLYSTEALIHEPAVFQPPSPSPAQGLDFKRIEYLTACLYATKATLDNFISLPLVHFTLPSSLSFSHSSQALYKLSLLDCPGWDRHLVRSTADVISYIEQTWHKSVQAAAETDKESGEESVFGRESEPIRATAVAWKEALDRATAAAPLARESAAVAGGYEGVEAAWMDFGTDVLFSDVFGQWS